jgi:hypothetical protein
MFVLVCSFILHDCSLSLSLSGDGAVLKNCQVAAGFEVSAHTKGSDECFNELGVHTHSDEDEDEGGDGGDNDDVNGDGDDFSDD